MYWVLEVCANGCMCNHTPFSEPIGSYFCKIMFSNEKYMFLSLTVRRAEMPSLLRYRIGLLILSAVLLIAFYIGVDVYRSSKMSRL